LGHATRAKLILAERYHVWPLAQPPDRLTAAQVGVLAEALRADTVPVDAEGHATKTDTARKRLGPRVSRAKLLELARAQDDSTRDVMQA